MNAPELLSTPEAELKTVQQEIVKAVDEGKKQPEFKAAVGLSREWDARKAGREVAEDTLKKLDGKKPDFFLLFSTIHYEKYGGFKELLKGVWDVLPEGTPLVGGTVAGFMNNYGCYTRGATSMAVSYPNMDVAVGVGHNTKRNPKKAAKECAEMIKKELGDSKYKNKFLLSLISGPTTLEIPSMGRKKILTTSGLISRFVMPLFGISQKIFQKGVGMESEILKELSKELPEYYMLTGSMTDDMRIVRNYQFFNNDVITNSVIALAIQSDMECDVNTTHGMEKTNIKFEITKTSIDKRVIHEINGKPAVQELLRLLKWPKEYLNERTLYTGTIYYPLGRYSGNILQPSIIGFVLGDSFLTAVGSENPETYILRNSGKSLIKSTDDTLSLIKKNPEFGLIFSCASRVQTLGEKSYIVSGHLQNYFKDKSFLSLFTAGEGMCSPRTEPTYATMAFNAGIFWR